MHWTGMHWTGKPRLACPMRFCPMRFSNQYLHAEPLEVVAPMKAVPRVNDVETLSMNLHTNHGTPTAGLCLHSCVPIDSEQ